MFSKVLIDADQIVYACGFASEGEPLSHTLATVRSALNKIQEAVGAEEREVYIGGSGNFRDEIALSKGYKAHRPKRKPEAYEEIRKYLVETQGAVVVDGMEADDAVSIGIYEDFIKADGIPGESTIIVSTPDKDLNNTPGWHFNPKKDSVTWVTEQQAGRHFLWQMLCGDSTDNIIGLPEVSPSISKTYKIPVGKSNKGLGAKRAKKIMSYSSDIEGALVDVMTCYHLWGQDKGALSVDTLEYFIEQANLLWMIRRMHLDTPVMYEVNDIIWKMSEKLATDIRKEYE
jgi:5'-3' exonuclease